MIKHLSNVLLGYILALVSEKLLGNLTQSWDEVIIFIVGACVFLYCLMQLKELMYGDCTTKCLHDHEKK